jgi:CBS domain-containing protein
MAPTHCIDTKPVVTGGVRPPRSLQDVFRVPLRGHHAGGLVTVAPDAPLDTVFRTLEEAKVSCAAVLEGDEAVGVVSATDLARAARFDPNVVGWPLRLSGGQTARTVMRSPLIEVDDLAPVSAACDAMVTHRVHRVFVRRAAAIVGVFSSRDVMRMVLAARIDVPLWTLMVSPVASVDVGDSVEVALDRLEASNLRGLAVVDGRKPLGVFTQREAIQARALPASLRRVPVEEAMSYEVLCLDAGTPLYRVAGHAVALQVRRILATELGELRGILTGYDLARIGAEAPARVGGGV